MEKADSNSCGVEAGEARLEVSYLEVRETRLVVGGMCEAKEGRSGIWIPWLGDRSRANARSRRVLGSRKKEVVERNTREIRLLPWRSQ